MRLKQAFVISITLNVVFLLTLTVLQFTSKLVIERNNKAALKRYFYCLDLGYYSHAAGLSHLRAHKILTELLGPDIRTPKELLKGTK